MKANPDDMVVLYYSGHGKTDGDGQLHLTFANTNLDILLATTVSLSSIHDMIRHTKCQRIVLILDCCYSGAVGNTLVKSALEDNLKKLTEGNLGGTGLFVMTASTAVQVAKEKHGDLYSLFTKHLLNGLNGGALKENSKGRLLVRDLYEYVHGCVTAEERQVPQYWELGGTGSATLSVSTDQALFETTIGEIKDVVRALKRFSVLPKSIEERLAIICGSEWEQVKREHLSFYEIAVSFARNGNLDEFLERWYSTYGQFHDQSRHANGNRIDVPDRARTELLESASASYLLDHRYHFIDWNAVFEEVFAKPLGLSRGTHVEDFIHSLVNRRAIIERSQTRFGTSTPLADIEDLEFVSPAYGLIKMKKIACQVSVDPHLPHSWCVSLNVTHVANTRFWMDVEAILARTANWSRYALTYDEILTRFKPYSELNIAVEERLAGASRIADLACGTGNLSTRLLARDRETHVVGFDSNERMLAACRKKVNEEQSGRLTLVKGDLFLSLREFPDGYFDGAAMVNALYAISDREPVLREITRVLREKSRLIVTTSHCGTDIDALFDAIRLEVGTSARMQQAIEDAYQRHLQMIDDITRDRPVEIVSLLESAGFKVRERIDSLYIDAVVLIDAEKA